MSFRNAPMDFSSVMQICVSLKSELPIQILTDYNFVFFKTCNLERELKRCRFIDSGARK